MSFLSKHPSWAVDAYLCLKNQQLENKLAGYDHCTSGLDSCDVTTDVTTTRRGTGERVCPKGRGAVIGTSNFMIQPTYKTHPEP